MRYRVTPEFRHRQEQQSALLVSDIIQDPSSWERAFRRYVALSLRCYHATAYTAVDHWRSSIVSFVHGTLYGVSSTSSSINIPDHVVKDFEDMTSDLTRAATPGAHLVDLLPWMLSLPDWMAKWKQEGYRWFQHRARILEELVDDVDQRVVRATLMTMQTIHDA